jgi:ATP-dependent RNA helicase DeaD
MQDKVGSEVTSATEEKVVFGHRFFETGADILSKPKALVDLLESMGVPCSVIFCNAPSEADLVAAMLRKNAISCQKLIGHVPSSKVEQTNDEVQAGTIKVVVTTDIGATELKMNNFEYIINYSIHEDPETYFNRCADVKPGAKIKHVLSLVSPLDLGNFHYLRKLAEFEFEKGELPTKADLMKGKMEKLFADAAASTAQSEEGMLELVEQITSNANSKGIIAFLLNNTLVALPEALAQARPKGGSQERGEFNDRGDRQGGRNDRRNDRGPRRDRDSNQDHPRRGQDENVKAEVRYYLGVGSSSTSVEQIKTLLTEKGLEDSAVKRIFLRDSYGFVDASTEAAEQVLAALKDTEIAGAKLYSVKATELPGSKPERHSDGQSDRREGGRGGRDRRRHGGHDRRDRHNQNEGGEFSAEGSDEDFADDDTSQVKMLANYKGELGKDRD